jgi:DNA-binding MarR family transcriptional regulator
MKKSPDKSAELIHLFGVVLNKFAAVEKFPRDFGTGDKLFPSEIHVIEAIGNHPGINMTELAAKLGVSKPAVTQMVGKVAGKRLLRRYKTAHNKKEVLVTLTEKGEIAFLGHREFHARMDAWGIERFNRLTSRESDFLAEIFQEMARYFDLVLEERSREVSIDQSPSHKGGQG